MAVRLGMTRAVAAHVTRSHRAVAYLLLLVYHLVSVHGRIGMSLCVFAICSSTCWPVALRLPTRASEGVTRSVSSPPVALRLAARCMSLLLLLSSPRVTSAGGKKKRTSFAPEVYGSGVFTHLLPQLVAWSFFVRAGSHRFDAL